MCSQGTGIGLARNTEETEEERAWNPHGSCDSSESAQGFFLADGTPNIQLRRFRNLFPRCPWNTHTESTPPRQVMFTHAHVLSPA